MLRSVVQCRNHDYAIIDTYSTTNFWYAFATSQLCRLLRLKYIPILHGGDLPNRLIKNPLISELIFKHSYRCVSPSLYLTKKFNDKNFLNLVTIPNTIELNKYPFQTKKCNAPKLLWVRSFAAIYNPKMAIEVFSAIKESYPSATFCMVGPDKDGSLLQTKQMANDLNTDVVFSGKLSKKDWIKLSNQYNVFINTTHFDNTPLSVIEAMALGLAVVSTNVGGIPFLINHEIDGLLVADNATTEMVLAIKKIVNNPDLFLQLTHNARHKIENFDWEIVKYKWFEILK